MVIKSSNFILLFLAPIIYFCFGYIEHIGFLGDTAIFEYLLIPASILLLIIYCYKNSPAFLFTSSMVFYYYIGMCLSLLMISSGMHMIEINKTGSPNGSAFIMFSVFVFSVGVSKTAFELGLQTGKNKPLPRISLKVVNSTLLITITLVLLLGLFIFIVYSGPVLKNVNRVAFWASMRSRGLSFFPTLVLQSFYLVAYYYLYRKYDKSNAKAALLFLILYLIATVMILGEKFSAFVIYISVYFAILPSFIKQLRINTKIILFSIFIFISIIIIITFSYLMQGHDGAFILVRAVLQGQLMWSIFNNSFPELMDTKLNCFIGCNGFDNGKEYISFKYLPVSTYLHYKDTATQLSGFAPALQFLTLGIIPGFILQTIVFIFLGLLQAKMVIYNYQRNFIMGFLLFKLSLTIFLIWHAIMFTAITGGFLTIIAIVFYIILCKSSYRAMDSETAKSIT